MQKNNNVLSIINIITQLIATAVIVIQFIQKKKRGNRTQFENHAFQSLDVELKIQNDEVYL
ncbi:hypothetical protein MTR07_08250 [Staphylococcus agnetis]|uniref:hypothetical protein n=1 Tax=Staphylococcus agnetis TaxID=985762 RepID=UPI00208F2BE1|nr:hypothetical protein [Staphylococcus agnetis]MCO4350818.1 hypothetical protein [Staphylococcus agnetis]